MGNSPPDRKQEQKPDRKKAEEWMIKALTVDPKNPLTRLAAAQWALNAERLDEARDQCDRGQAQERSAPPLEPAAVVPPLSGSPFHDCS